jgi:hypothetical protein
MRQPNSQNERPWAGLASGFVAGLLFCSPRIMSLPFLLFALIISQRRFRAQAFTMYFAWTMFLASLLSPIDLAVPGLAYPGLLRGNSRSGVRLVRVVVGMPAHTSLVNRYGEYYSAGCSGYWLFQPIWVLTLQ